MKRPDFDDMIEMLPSNPLIGIPLFFILVAWYLSWDGIYWMNIGRKRLAHSLGWHTYAWWHNVEAQSIWRCRKCGRLQFRKHKFYGEQGEVP